MEDLMQELFVYHLFYVHDLIWGPWVYLLPTAQIESLSF